VSRKKDIEKLLDEHRRRLHQREMQHARYGIAADPHIPMEIEDIKARVAALEEELAALAEIACHNPYRGLFAFREEDEPVFFGREAFTAQLVTSVPQKPLVAVLGPSGSGKSSVVFAGLVPRLTRSGPWCVAAFRPGKEPFLGLASALVPLYETAATKTEQLGAMRDLAAGLRAGRYPLADVLHLIHQTHPNNRILVIVDQCEEVYTLCRDADTRQRFLDTLLQIAAAGAEASVRLVLTMRADFLGQALLYLPLGNALQGSIELLRPMNRDELRMAIEQPAAQHQVGFEPGLVERILNDVQDEPGNLPLLEFALTALWEQQVHGELTHAAYERVAGVAGALSRHAEAVFTGLGEAEQEQTRRVFIQLVRPGEGMVDTRRLAYRHELGETDWQFVQQLAGERLVVTNWDPAGQETVEVAHEALIHGWRRLATWMEENRDFRAWQERLRIALAQWQDSLQQDEGSLLRGKPLAEVEHWLAEREDDLSHAERDFIQASRALRKREQRREQGARRVRRFAIALVTLLLLLVFRSWWTVTCPHMSGFCPAVSLAGIDLFRVDLSGADLGGADLGEADLWRADLEGADLREADLRRADLRRADLREADLTGADLRRAGLTGADLGGAALRGADLGGTDLYQANLGGADLFQANLGGADLIGADLTGANLSGADLTGANIDATTHTDDKWRLVWEIVTHGAAGRDLGGVDLREADLEGANLREADLEGSNLGGANLGGTDLYQANLGRVNLRGANLRRADLRGADLGGADLHEADLRGANIDATTHIDDKWRLVWEIVTHGAAGRDLFRADLGEANLFQADLGEANLFQADLGEANLFRADLVMADLCESNLGEADLREANLFRADLGEADLGEADLGGADLHEADLREADLREANLVMADLEGADLFQANLQWANLGGADLHEADLREANLQWANPNGANPNRVTLGRINLEGADLREADLGEANLQWADLGEANLQWADLHGANLRGANLREANLQWADLGEANLQWADLRGADLGGADLFQADLGGADLFQADLQGARFNEETFWPAEFDPVEAGAVRVDE
jgi:uncharacterized protein YjbI with pentapeptide repeats